MGIWRTVRLACCTAAVAVQHAGAAAQGTEPSAAAPFDGACGDFYLEVADEGVTLLAINACIQDVLEALAAATDLRIVAPRELEGRLTLELRGVALHAVVIQLLRGRSFVLYQASGRTSDSRSERRGERGWLLIHPEHSLGRAEVPGIELASSHTPLRAVRRARTLGEDAQLAALGPALVDHDPSVRVQAIYALARSGSGQAAGLLATALADENVGVREEAAYALGVIGDDAAIGLLEHALRDPDPGVRAAAVEALGDIGSAAAVGVLGTVVRHADSSVREQAVEALARAEGDLAVGALCGAVQDPDRAIRAAAQEALGASQPCN